MKLAAAIMLLTATLPALASPIASREVRVVDGDTVGVRGELYRLVGLNAPETSSHAACERERTAGAAATRHLRQLVAGGGVDLQRVHCACRPGTEGTPRCNYGRLCAVLTVRGKRMWPPS